MAISIDWGNRIINVPRADMTLLQLTPVEIRELDLNLFRLELKSLEASEDGMPFPITHNHNTEVSLGGLVYARIIEITNGYTVTFEDGVYSVNLAGANSNVGDVINANQVSVRSANSAGLISNRAIEYSSFNSGVIIDVANLSGKAVSGTTFPAGTEQSPSTNESDAYLISEVRGFSDIKIKGNLNITNVVDWSSHNFYGESITKTLITIDAAATVNSCEFYEASITGTLDAYAQLERCLISNLNYVNGLLIDCALASGTITLGAGTQALFENCYSAVAGTSTPIVDMNGTGTVVIRGYKGGIQLDNYSGVGSSSLDLDSGQIKLNPANITSGIFVVRGVGKLIDSSTGDRIPSGTWNGGVTIINELVDSKDIKDTLLVSRQIKALTIAGL